MMGDATRGSPIPLQAGIKAHNLCEENAHLQHMQRLPLWGLAKWKVTPLETLEGRTARDRQFIEQLEQSL